VRLGVWGFGVWMVGVCVVVVVVVVWLWAGGRWVGMSDDRISPRWLTPCPLPPLSFPLKHTHPHPQGVLQLYRGITPTLLGILPYAGIAFTINDKANHQVRYKTKRVGTGRDEIMGSCTFLPYTPWTDPPASLQKLHTHTHTHTDQCAQHHLPHGNPLTITTPPSTKQTDHEADGGGSDDAAEARVWGLCGTGGAVWWVGRGVDGGIMM
jgi:hypothetical protein